MKILFTSHKFFPDVGGIEVNSFILANYFAQSGHEVFLVTQTPAPAYSVNYTFTVIRKPSAIKLFILTLTSDIVYQNNIELKSLYPALILRKKYIIASRTWIRATCGRIRLIDRLKRYLIRKANASIAISKSVQIASCTFSTVIGNPFRDDIFRLKKGFVGRKTFLFVGRLVSDKGADILIEAFHKLIMDVEIVSECFNQGFALHLTIVGDGPERDILENNVHALSLQSDVSFQGSLPAEKLVDVYNEHLICVVPSRWEEPFGNVALEAMACGCTVIGSHAGGLVDAIGDAGLTFERGSITALVGCMKNLIHDQNLRESLRSNAPTHLSNHTVATVGRRYLDVIESV